jgi:hypothetical protein
LRGSDHFRQSFPILDAQLTTRSSLLKGLAFLGTQISLLEMFHLSDVHIQMARELGLNPKKFGGLADHRQEPWKLPLPEFIAACYRKRFHRSDRQR